MPGPLGDSTSDTALVVAACVAAESAGRPTVLLAPGHYRLDGLTVSGAKNRYLIGDGVTFSQDSWVYPFGTAEFAGLSARHGRTGGRGRIAIELDDGVLTHWREMFPLTKRLGITIGSAWHTSNGSQWIAKAHRHGWEIIAHMPENITAVDYLTAGGLDAAAVSCLDRIEVQIGTREGIGFVYLQHVLSAETDRILSKYFTRGRGIAGPHIYPKGSGHPWLTTARNLDSEFTGGTVSDAVKRDLQQVAVTDGQMVFYMHMDGTNAASQKLAVTEFVRLARELGIDIVNPGQIWGNRNMVADPYVAKAANVTVSGIASVDTTKAYHGPQSIKLTTGAVAGIGSASLRSLELTSRPGCLGVYRASVRYSAVTDVAVTSAGQGLRFTLAWQYRKIDGGIPSSGSSAQATPNFPATGTTIPAADWARVQQLIYIGPATQRATLGVQAANLAANSIPIWLDEFKLELMDWVASVTYETT